MSITTITLLLLSMIPALVIVMCHRFENLLARAECGSMGRPRYLWRNTLVVFLVVTQAAMPLHYGGVFTSLKAWLGESERSFSLSGNIIRAGAAENNLSAWEMLSKDSAEIVNSTSQLYAPSNDLNQNSSTEVYFTMPANWNFKFDDFSDNWYEGGHNWSIPHVENIDNNISDADLTTISWDVFSGADVYSLIVISANGRNDHYHESL